MSATKKIKTEPASGSKPSKSSSSSTSNALVVELTKPGQRYPMESPGSGDYVFYQTLYKENPESNMALVWCIEHGVFSREIAGSLMKKYEVAKKTMLQLNRQGLGDGSTSSSSSSSSKQKHKKKRKLKVHDDVGVDPGMSVTMYEGIGTMGGV